MSGYSTDGRNAMLDHLGTLADFASLHTAFSASGASEVAGGAPAYSREAMTWAAAAGGSMAATSAPVFDVPAATTVRYIGLWSLAAAGTFYGMFPNGGGTPVPFTAEDTTDVLTADNHGFADGTKVTVFDTGGAVIPTGLTEGDVYFVVTSTTDTLQLSLTSGGAAINLTTDGAGFLQTIVEEAFGAQGTLTLSSMTLNLNL